MDFVSILMPALNEEEYIESAIISIMPPAEHGIDFEILVLDGGSSDGTRAIVDGIAARDRRIRYVDNPKRLQSAAINLGAAIADSRSPAILRADCHAIYPPGFVRTILDALERSGAASVVVPMHTTGESCLQRAIAAAQNSRLGTGGSPHRHATRSQFVDHGHHAAFRRDIFTRLGGYDETFSHNEDAELDARIRADGGRIWLAGDAAVGYLPRSTFPALARQYFRHGKGRARTMLKHRMRPKPRQLAPVAVLLANLAALLALPAAPLAALLPAGYGAACLAYGALLATRANDRCVLAAGPAAMVMHMAWASGFLATMLGPRRAQPSIPAADPAPR